MPFRKYIRVRPTPLVAAFAIFWVIARACVQTITVDEAVTFNNYVGQASPSHWLAHANNHLLNSMIMRVFTSIFGVSMLTVRSGAITGALIYIFAAYSLCRFAGERLQLLLFVCLVYNPMILDFLVAARGYGLASAFLLSALAIVVSAQSREETPDFRSLRNACMLASVCLALSFVANFSFALIDISLFVAIYCWANWSTRWTKFVELAAATALPGLAVAVALAGSVLLSYPKDELVYGARTFGELMRSLNEASVFEVSPYIVNPLFRDALAKFSLYLIPVVGAICLLRLAVLIAERGLVPRDSHTKILFGLAMVVAGAVVIAMAGHWTAFRVLHVLYPKDRTGIYLVVLLTLLAGVVAAVPLPTRWGAVSQRVATAALAVLAAYFVLCLRVSYFKEWKWDSDVDKVYSELAYYNHTCGLRDVTVNWRFDGPLNFYSLRSGRENFSEFKGTIFDYPLDKRAYVLYFPGDEKFVSDHHLTVVYRGETGAAVAIDPAMQPSAGGSACDVSIPASGMRW